MRLQYYQFKSEAEYEKKEKEEQQKREMFKQLLQNTLR